MKLFTYTIPVDDGAAPNPFGGYCTLTICKPAIRRAAKEGDWIAGFGSKNAPSGDLSGKLVYAMKITEVMTMKEYDSNAPSHWPFKIPNIKSVDMSTRLGDCIYDFSTNPPKQRTGVHGPGNRDTDLSGKNALISSHFYYFGRNAVPIPESLLPILHQTQGHKSSANDKYIGGFIDWINSLNLEPGQLYGWPDFVVQWLTAQTCGCATRQSDGENDQEVTE